MTAARQPLRVLVAEDEALIRMDLAEMLAEEGYEVVGQAGDGQKAIELARDLAIRFNSRFGEGTLVVPKHVIPPVAGRVMDLQNPAAKMSKSSVSPAGRIEVLDSQTAAGGMGLTEKAGLAALAQRVVVLGQGLGVLAVGGAHAADGRDAQRDQVAVGLRAVALEVAVQAALALPDFDFQQAQIARWVEKVSSQEVLAEIF
mgnify:CR=1 FL=1